MFTPYTMLTAYGYLLFVTVVLGMRIYSNKELSDYRSRLMRIMQDQSAATRKSNSLVPDSYGEQFVFLIPQNRQQSAPFLLITNPNYSYTNVTITYLSMQQQTYSFKIESTDIARVELPGLSTAGILGNGIAQVQDIRVHVSASQPISLTLNNYASGGKNVGDSFIVLPTSMAGKQYALSVPPTANSNPATVYFIPTAQDAEISITVNVNGTQEQYSRTAQVASGTAINLYSSRKQFTMFVTGSAAFFVIVAVEGLPDSNYANASTDFGSFMPLPINNLGCDKKADEVYMSMLLTANTFLITAPTVNCTLSLQFLGSNNQNSSAVLTGTNAVLQTLSSNKYGNSVAMISRAELSILRYGGYNMAQPGLAFGSFLDQIVPWEYFASGLVIVPLPSASNSITIISDEVSTNETISSMNIIWSPIEYFGRPAYSFVFTTSASNFVFYSPKLFTIYVTGTWSNGVAYGYVAAYNKPSTNKQILNKSAGSHWASFATVITLAILSHLLC